MTARHSPAESLDPAHDIAIKLQEDIVVGRLGPGARLVEEDLAARFATKRYVLRQALTELEQSGLIERKRNRGASVRELTPDDVGQIYAVRKLLERAAAAQIPLPLEPHAFARIEAAQRNHDAAVALGDARAVFRANFEFHHALFAACGNAYLTQAIADFRRKSHIVWSFAIIKPKYFATAQREHHAMLKALRAGDRRKLVDLCVEHLGISQHAFVETHRLRYPE